MCVLRSKLTQRNCCCLWKLYTYILNTSPGFNKNDNFTMNKNKNPTKEQNKNQKNIKIMKKNQLRTWLAFHRERGKRDKQDLTSRNRTILIEFCKIYIYIFKYHEKKNNSI